MSLNFYAMGVLIRYGLSCAGLGENLLKDIEVNLGLATHEEVDEYFGSLENEGEAQNTTFKEEE